MFPNEYPNLFFVPFIPVINEKPPTLYSLLQSIVNYGKEEKTKIKDLASAGRTTIFDFDYPLSNKITKEDFEKMILNHFLMRRIGFETLTAFKIQLNVKLNEIMPMYNKLIELLYSNDAFGEITKRKGFDNRVVDNTSNTTNEMTNVSNTKHQNISDRRGSDTPQNELDNIRQGKYVTEYHYDTDNSNNEDTSASNGTSQNISNTKDNNNYEETTSKINMFEIYSKLNEEIKNIYTMIFKDLDCLFYQLV
jgi:hypothetical protein